MTLRTIRCVVLTLILFYIASYQLFGEEKVVNPLPIRILFAEHFTDDGIPLILFSADGKKMLGRVHTMVLRGL